MIFLFDWVIFRFQGISRGVLSWKFATHLPHTCMKCMFHEGFFGECTNVGLVEKRFVVKRVDHIVPVWNKYEKIKPLVRLVQKRFLFQGCILRFHPNLPGRTSESNPSFLSVPKACHQKYWKHHSKVVVPVVPPCPKYMKNIHINITSTFPSVSRGV